MEINEVQVGSMQTKDVCMFVFGTKEETRNYSLVPNAGQSILVTSF